MLYYQIVKVTVDCVAHSGVLILMSYEDVLLFFSPQTAVPGEHSRQNLNT